jgi:hypothetical protein
MVMVTNRAVIALSLALIGDVAPAHHSFSMFEPVKETILAGTVTRFEWTNPHTWIELDVLNGDGTWTHWSIEGGSLVVLQRQGWRSDTLKPGDKITLVMHPLRDGRCGGSLIGLVTASGKTLGQPLYPPKQKASDEGTQPGT